MKRLAILAVSGLVSVSANASNWVQIDDDDTATTYIDTDSISNSRGYKQLFMRINFHSIKTYSDGKRRDEVVALLDIDCNSQPPRYKILSSLSRMNNKVVDYDHIADDWVFIYPDSLGNVMVKYACP